MNDITVWKITCFSESLSIKEKNGRDDTATRACWLKTSPTEFAQLTLITPQGSKTPPHLQEVFKWCPPQKPKVKATVETVPKTRKEKGEKKATLDGTVDLSQKAILSAASPPLPSQVPSWLEKEESRNYFLPPELRVFHCSHISEHTIFIAHFPCWIKVAQRGECQLQTFPKAPNES